jgi:hypothetical protein
LSSAGLRETTGERRVPHMPTELVCDHCGAVLLVPGDNRGPWVECPHCHGRVVRPQARPRAAGPGRVGGLLIVAGLLGAVAWIFAVVVAVAESRARDRTLIWGLWFGLVAFMFVAVAGGFVARARQDRANRVALLIGAAFALLAAATLFVTSSAIAVVRACFGQA